MVDEAGAVEEMSIGPTSRASASTASFERTSSLRLSASRPLRPATSMSVAMTRAPSRAKASAVPRPMPAAAAVNNATLPANRPAIGPLLRFCFPRPSGAAPRF